MCSQNYTTYKTYYGLIKAIEDDPKVERKKAAQALARFMSLHPHNIAQKTEVIVEHFRTFTCAQDRRPGQGHGGHRLAAARGAVQAGVRQVHQGERLHRHQGAGGVLGHGRRPGRARIEVHRGRR